MDPEIALIVALVVLQPASGIAPGGFDEITARNVARYLPSSAEVKLTQSAFRSAGFNVGPFGGASFSIEGSKNKFEQYFGVKLVNDASGVWVEVDNGERSRELPLDAVPDAIASILVTIVFEPPSTLDDRGDGDLSGLDP